MSNWHGYRLEAMTAEEQEQIQTANGVRQRIREASYSDPLIMQVLRMAAQRGLSSEETYVYLAYHALVAAQKAKEYALDIMNTTPGNPTMVAKP